MTDEFPLKEETYHILGACFEVYNQMGCGFLESVYQECLAKEMTERGISFEAQPVVQLEFKGQTLDRTFSPEFFCFATVIVEIKAVKRLAAEHRAQVINYLRASRVEVGLLVNFGSYPDLQYERIVHQTGRFGSVS